jgi:putative addiction module component (TIGR02574 family)
MTPVTYNEISDKALTLPTRQRARLAHKLIKSLEKKQEAGLDKLWDAEIKRRVGEIKSGRMKERPAESVLAEIRARYS